MVIGGSKHLFLENRRSGSLDGLTIMVPSCKAVMRHSTFNKIDALKLFTLYTEVVECKLQAMGKVNVTLKSLIPVKNSYRT